jgi:hypothetical protein
MLRDRSPNSCRTCLIWQLGLLLMAAALLVNWVLS